MTDIVERLRAPVDWTKFPERMFAEAADEIERLRGEIVIFKESLNKANAKNSQILQRLHDAKMKGRVDG